MCDLAAQGCKLYRLAKYEYRDRPEKVERVIDDTSREIITAVEEIFPKVPKEWNYAWARAWATISVAKYHKVPTPNESQNFEIPRQPSRPLKVEVESGKSGHTNSATLANGLPLYEAMMSIKIVGNDLSDPGKTYESEISKCLYAGRHGKNPEDYLFDLFTDHFQYIIEENGEKYNLYRGKHQYNDGSGSRVTIRNQHDFEAALEFYLRERDEYDNHIYFIFYPETVHPTRISTQRIHNAPPLVNKDRQEGVNTSQASQPGIAKQTTAPEGSKQTDSRTRLIRAQEAAYSEKIPRLRNMFRPGKLPTDGVLQQALLSSKGDIARAFAKLGGKPKPSTNPSERAGRIPDQLVTERPRARQKTALPPNPEDAPSKKLVPTVSKNPKIPERVEEKEAITSSAPVPKEKTRRTSLIARFANPEQRRNTDDTVSPIAKSPSLYSATPSSAKQRRSFIMAPFAPLAKIFQNPSKEEMQSPQSSVGDVLDHLFPEVKRVLYRSGGPDEEDSFEVPEYLKSSKAPRRITEEENQEPDKPKDRIAQ